MQIEKETRAFKLSSRASRLSAFVVDLCLVAIILMGAMFFNGVYDKILEAAALQKMYMMNVNELLQYTSYQLLIYLLLNFHLLYKHGQTIGKRLFKIRIISYEGGGVPPLKDVVGKRFLLMFLFQVLPFGIVITLVDYLMIFKDDKRCLHDRIANTFVVDVVSKPFVIKENEKLPQQ